MIMENFLGVVPFIKTHSVAFLASVIGAIAHAFERIRANGWVGWFSFTADIFVCVFFGNVFYQITSISMPEYAIIATSLGAFWGPKSFDYLKTWLLKSLKANIETK